MIATKHKCIPRLFLGCLLLYSLLIHTGGLVEGAENKLRDGKKDPPIVSGFPDSYTPSQKDGLKNAVLSIQAGYMPRKGSTFDLLDNLSNGQLFDGPKLESFMEADFVPSTSVKVVYSMEEDVNYFSREIKLGLQVSASSNFLVGTFEANAAAEVGMASQLESKNVLVYKRDIYFFGILQLPYHPYDKSGIQALMDPIVLTDLKTISSHEEAMRYVESFGVGYFQTSYYGGIFKMSSKLVKESWFEKSDVHVSFEANFSAFKKTSASGSGSTRVSLEKGTEHTSYTVTHIARGGDVTKIGDDDVWKESTKDSPVVGDYAVVPLYELLSSTGDEDERRARNYLENAVAEYISKYKFSIPSFDPPGTWVNFDRNGLGHESYYGRLFGDFGGYMSSDLYIPSNDMYSPLSGLDCYDDYCANFQFRYSVYEYMAIFREAGEWTDWLSEHEQGEIQCPNGKAVRQFQCKHKYCTDMRIKCAGLVDGFRIQDIFTSRSKWLSNPSGLVYCNGSAIHNQVNSHYIVGIVCGQEENCGSLQLLCKNIQSSVISMEGEEGEHALEALHEGEYDQFAALEAYK